MKNMNEICGSTNEKRYENDAKRCRSAKSDIKDIQKKCESIAEEEEQKRYRRGMDEEMRKKCGKDVETMRKWCGKNIEEMLEGYGKNVFDSK